MVEVRHVRRHIIVHLRHSLTDLCHCLRHVRLVFLITVFGVERVEDVGQRLRALLLMRRAAEVDQRRRRLDAAALIPTETKNGSVLSQLYNSACEY